MTTEDKPRPEKRVDEDWKKRAAEEKAKMIPPPKPAAPAAGAPPVAGADPAAGAAPPPPEEPPAGGRRRGGPFETLVTMLVQQASMMLGLVADPMTGERYQDVGQAKLLIDMLVVLRTKTKGNLTPDEDRYIAAALSELQMEFVQLADAMAQRRGQKPKPGL